MIQISDMRMELFVQIIVTTFTPKSTYPVSITITFAKIASKKLMEPPLAELIVKVSIQDVSVTESNVITI